MIDQYDIINESDRPMSEGAGMDHSNTNYCNTLHRFITAAFYGIQRQIYRQYN